ncbi:hypothetical protein [Litchfieldia alkalitelluris]|uniref:hypothetical protein n=1 Tax=Litchfieldia alkalitelluris TaxID=304268 RepID=UPI000995DF14|nr:hypothetical protein [Litchfieldia alkalitelluris]
MQQFKMDDIVKAKHSMINEINNLYLACRERLFENDILQWDEQYPNVDYFKECINRQDLYVYL